MKITKKLFFIFLMLLPSCTKVITDKELTPKYCTKFDNIINLSPVDLAKKNFNGDKTRLIITFYGTYGSINADEEKLDTLYEFSKKQELDNTVNPIIIGDYPLRIGS